MNVPVNAVVNDARLAATAAPVALTAPAPLAATAAPAAPAAPTAPAASAARRPRRLPRARSRTRWRACLIAVAFGLMFAAQEGLRLLVSA